MATYSREDLEGEWEFKIVRSVTGEFKKPEVFNRVRDEESLAGWVLVEKFDDQRLRFKRPVSAQRKDQTLPPHVDPYRTQYGISEGVLAVWIVIAIMLAVSLLIVMIRYFENGGF
ncbi:MAG: hypothetical protein AB1649_14915 [Chloroflexota bacterium]